MRCGWEHMHGQYQEWLRFSATDLMEVYTSASRTGWTAAVYSDISRQWAYSHGHPTQHEAIAHAEALLAQEDDA